MNPDQESLADIVLEHFGLDKVTEEEVEISFRCGAEINLRQIKDTPAEGMRFVLEELRKAINKKIDDDINWLLSLKD